MQCGRAICVRVKRGESWQPTDRVGDGVAVRIDRCDRNVQDFAFGDVDGTKFRQHRRTIGIRDVDDHLGRTGGRQAGAVAIIRGRELHDVSARLGVARRPGEHECLGIELRTHRQSACRHGDTGRGTFQRRDQATDAILGEIAGIVGVERKRTQRNQLPLKRRDAVEPVEERGGVHVADNEHEGALAHRLAIGSTDRDLVTTGLHVVRGPLELARVRVQERANWQIRGEEPQRIAVGVVGREPDVHGVALANVPFRHALQDGRRVTWLHREGQKLRDAAQAVGRDDLHIPVDARCSIPGRPGERMRLEVEACVRRQPLHEHRQGIAVRVRHRHWQRECTTFGKREVGRQATERRRPIAAGDHDRETLIREATARVVGAQQDRHAVVRIDRRGPSHETRRRIDRHSLRPFHQQIRDGNAIRIDGMGLVPIRLTGHGSCHGRGIKRGHGVRIGQRVKRMTNVRPLERRVVDHKRPHHGGLPGTKSAIGESAAHVDEPQLRRRVEGRTTGFARKITRRIEHQHQWSTEVVRRDVGDADVVRDRAGGTIGARRREVNPHNGREVLDRYEARREGLGERQPEAAPQTRIDGHRVVAGLDGVERQEGSSGSRVVAHAGNRDLGAVSPDNVVRRVKDGGRLCAVRRLHRLVERDCDLAHGQR